MHRQIIHHQLIIGEIPQSPLQEVEYTADLIEKVQTNKSMFLLMEFCFILAHI